MYAVHLFGDSVFPYAPSLFSLYADFCPGSAVEVSAYAEYRVVWCTRKYLTSLSLHTYMDFVSFLTEDKLKNPY